MVRSCHHLSFQLAAPQLGSQQPWLPWLKQGSLASRLPARKFFIVELGQLELGLPGPQRCSLIRYTGELVSKWVDFFQKIQLRRYIPVKQFDYVKLAFFKWKSVLSKILCPALLISASIHKRGRSFWRLHSRPVIEMPKSFQSRAGHRLTIQHPAPLQYLCVFCQCKIL